MSNQSFKMTKDLISMLEFVSKINPSISFDGSNRVAVVSTAGNSFFRVLLDEAIPAFSVYDVTTLLKMSKLFGEPVIEIDSTDNKVLLIKSPDQSAIGRYVTCDNSLIAPIINNDVGSSVEVDATFQFNSKWIAALIKSAHAINATSITFNFDLEKSSVLLHDKNCPNGNTISLDIVAKCTKPGSYTVDLDDFKIYPASYELTASSEGILVLRSIDEVGSLDILFSIAF